MEDGTATAGPTFEYVEPNGQAIAVTLAGYSLNGEFSR
jgi:hypothetical protein